MASTVSVPGSLSAGGVVSATLTLKLPLVRFPWASVAVQVTVVCPSGKGPGGGEHFGVTVPVATSVAETV